MVADDNGERAGQPNKDVVLAKFPPGSYFDLKEGIWTLAKSMLAEELGNAIAPATVHAYPRRVGALAADLSVDFSRHEVTRKAVVSRFTATLSEIEPYRARPDSELWFWRRFLVDLVDPGLGFERGVSILGRRSVTHVKLGVPAPPESEAGEEAWRNAQYLGRSTSDDYRWFMKNLPVVTRGLR
jgi:hypothetical protein